VADRWMRDLPDGVTISHQVEFLISECDAMLKQTRWVLERGGDVQDVVTARRLRRFILAAKERLQTVPKDADPQATWTPREMQALLFALNVDTPIDFNAELEEDK
jgi:hypothetical protein